LPTDDNALPPVNTGLILKWRYGGNGVISPNVTANATTEIALCIELWIFYTSRLSNVKNLAFSLQKSLSLYRFFKILYKWKLGD